MRILGLSGLYHDSAAALIEDGRIVAAAQEERFTRKRHDASFPVESIRFCLLEAGITLADVDSICFYDKPFLKFERILETYLAFAPRGFRSFKRSMPIWLKEKLFQKSILVERLRELGAGPDVRSKLLFAEHHQSHAASAFFPSPFNEALVLTMDGVGEWATTSVAIGRGASLEVVRELHFPHSLGLLYSAFTYYTGFKVNSGEYKVMGLAPYGTPRFKKSILENLLDLKTDGSFRLDMSYFDYCTGLTMTTEKFHTLFGGPPRKSDEPLTQRHKDLAASIQAALEEIVLRMATSLADEFGQRNLCLAGGVALNCVANGKLLRSGRFDGVWIQPASGDAGGALGAALAAYHLHHEKPRVRSSLDKMNGAFLGPSFSQADVSARLRKLGAKFIEMTKSEIIDVTADSLARGEAVGWFSGKMEYGPRALGARSILADPRPEKMQHDLNLKVKFRESFRPFAPSVLREDAAAWFDLDADSPYMLLVADVREKHPLPAVTHVDGSARVQTVLAETNPRFHALLSAFKARTGCPVLVNTSFNVRGEPIVCTPEDAFRCFMGTDLDTLVVENCYLKKSDQDVALLSRYEGRFELD